MLQWELVRKILVQKSTVPFGRPFSVLNYFIYHKLYLLIDLDGGNVPLSATANQRRGFREIRHSL